MIQDTCDKEDILDRLILVRRRLQLLQARMTLHGKEENARQVRRMSNEVSREIDRLLNNMVRDWVGTFDELREDIKGSNAKLRSRISSLNKNVENVRKFVKVVEVVDDILKAARSL